MNDKIENRAAIEAALVEALEGFEVKNAGPICLERADGAGFFLARDWQGKRFNVYGNYPQSSEGAHRSPREWGVTKYGTPELTISVSTTRDPKAIAKDIVRRFLPQYLELHAACMVRKAESDAYQSAKDDAFATLVAVAPQGTRETPGKEHAHWYNSGKGSGVLQAYPQHASLELRSIPLPMMAQILKLLASED